MTPEQVEELIRVRIMSEAYDLADRNDSEGYNSIKVMCNEVLPLISLAVAEEREACAKVCDAYAELHGISSRGSAAHDLADTIRARGQEGKT